MSCKLSRPKNHLTNNCITSLISLKMFGLIFNHRRTIKSSIIICALALTVFILVESKNLPDEKQATKDEAARDPLVAIPSEVQHMSVERTTPQSLSQPQSEHDTRYFRMSQEGLQNNQQGATQQDQPSNAAQQGGYYLVQPDGTVIQHIPEQNLEAPKTKGRQEYISLIPTQQQQQQQQQASEEPRRGYPGEILYVDPNGESARPLSEVSRGQGPNDYSNIASAISRSSGLPATILTEVPVRDMTQDVLEKLKKDYGVKVVATREYPGANLVINCDDYSVQENSLCTRQSLQAVPQLQHVQQPNHHHQELQQQNQHQQQQQPQQVPQHEPIQNTHIHYSPYQYTSIDEHASDGESQSNEQPQIPGTNQRAEPDELPRGYYETRDGETRAMNQDSASNAQGFGNKEVIHSENTYQSGVDNQAEQLVSARANESKEEHERQEGESGRGF